MFIFPCGRLGSAVLLIAATGCHGGSNEEPESATRGAQTESQTAPAPAPFGARGEQPLEPSALGEAIRALRPYAKQGNSVLEVRADAARVVLQMRVGDSATIAEYVYDGRVLGPVPTHLGGDGELGTNLFELDAVDWDALGRLFPRARDSVDPLDGRVTGVVVRRHLPFSNDVRARLYVASPRMSGHLDADAGGKEITSEPDEAHP